MCEYGVDYAVWCHLVGAGEHLARRNAGGECEIFTHSGHKDPRLLNECNLEVAYECYDLTE